MFQLLFLRLHCVIFHPEDLQYSIDEFLWMLLIAIIDLVLQYMHFAKDLNEIYEETGIYCTVGIGSNMLLSKIAMDVEAKHSQNGIAEWRYQDVPTKLWPIQPLAVFGY